ncbi:MAG TPA: hypothetical protein VFC99_18120, partial [Acidimicrobiia bacterium]|nr:hypothetical protein [Acidimicrobiia bacterium]
MTDADPTSLAPRAGITIRELEVTPDLLGGGLTLWGAPLAGLRVGVSDLVTSLWELSWDTWPTTIFVREISLSTAPAPAGSSPPEAVASHVSIIGYGFEPGIPVRTKWNNAFGFPDNGAGANSILLQTSTPDEHGRFGFVATHTTVKRAAKDWYWESNNQL